MQYPILDEVYRFAGYTDSKAFQGFRIIRVSTQHIKQLQHETLAKKSVVG